MIIFHEGMPRSGKSYAAMADHIIPALKKGRRVYARLDGIDHAKIAEVAGIDEKTCAELLIELSEEDVKHLTQYSFDKDALIVLDELQNYWPQRRQPLEEALTKWIAEHGHHGWDVLCMGQVLKDCHRTWMNRTNRKIQFQKKDVLGKPNEYKWTMYSGKLDGNGVVKFIEVTKGDAEYDPKYFGCYKSHSEGTENTENYSDDRVVIWNSPIFRKWLPLFGVVLLCSIGYIVYFFRGGMAPAPAPAKPVAVTETVTTSGPGQTTKTVTRDLLADAKPAKDDDKPKDKDKEPAKDEFDLPDYLTQLSKDHKIRLGLVVRTAAATRVLIEWRDSSMRVVESLQIPDIEVLGWHVLLTTNDRMAILVKPGQKLVATAWPIEETTGKATVQQLDEIRGQRRPGAAPAPDALAEAPQQAQEFIPPKQYLKERYAYTR